ncbi:hypothetical protein BBJ28_00010721 [Nothophytophthora sp. Chile5]|nr:hypothetical protein BBJ28_00010721 [Nothophytophthora sp. Chile5]
MNRLACSFTCKNSNIKGYPAYEITLLFLYAYGSYALAEVMKLSGIMSLFFCGIIMAHYNSYNLSKPSQVTAEHIFKSFALVSEFFVFLYMGMGVWTGQFGRWDFTFVLLAIIFCLVARLFNTFPFSWLANQGNMPGPNQDLYVTTTLSGMLLFYLSEWLTEYCSDVNACGDTFSVCIFTTIICGGLTEPLLTYTDLKVRQLAVA